MCLPGNGGYGFQTTLTSGTTSQPFTLYWAGRIRATSNGNLWDALGSAGGGTQFYWYVQPVRSTNGIRYYSNANEFSTANLLPTSGAYTKFVLCAVLNGSSSIIQTDRGSGTGNLGTGVLRNMILGGNSNQVNFDFYEAFVRTTADDAAARSMRLSYLKSKWGIA